MRYFDDIAIGENYRLGPRAITLEDSLRFCAPSNSSRSDVSRL